MEFEKIMLLTINGLSFTILLTLFVLLFIEKKRIKEKLAEESMRLEKIINDYFEQANNEIKALKIESEKIKQSIANSVEQLNTRIKSSENSISKDISRNFETLRLDIQDIGQDFANRIENLNKQMNKSYNQLNIKINNLEKFLKEPIDIEEWINESDR